MQLFLDSVIAILLVATIVYCFNLNQRLSALRDAQEEFKGLIRSLDEATHKAQVSIEDLKAAALEAGQELETRTAAARLLSDELSVICQSGNNLAARLTDKLTEPGKSARGNRKGKGQTVPFEPPASLVEREKSAPAEDTSADEELVSELLDTLRRAR